MAYIDWAEKWPQAAAELREMQGALPWATNTDNEGKSENWGQQQVRMKVFSAGSKAWRNNVGATPAKINTSCPKCAFKFQFLQQPIRYGLANDSKKLNNEIKSADLILAIPRLITLQMVGSTIAQFGSVEVKKPGWKYTGKGPEPGQANWAAMIQSIGGFAVFSTGEITL